MQERSILPSTGLEPTISSTASNLGNQSAEAPQMSDPEKEIRLLIQQFEQLNTPPSTKAPQPLAPTIPIEHRIKLGEGVISGEPLYFPPAPRFHFLPTEYQLAEALKRQLNHIKENDKSPKGKKSHTLRIIKSLIEKGTEESTKQKIYQALLDYAREIDFKELEKLLNNVLTPKTKFYWKSEPKTELHEQKKPKRLMMKTSNELEYQISDQFMEYVTKNPEFLRGGEALSMVIDETPDFTASNSAQIEDEAMRITCFTSDPLIKNISQDNWKEVVKNEREKLRKKGHEDAEGILLLNVNLTYDIVSYPNGKIVRFAKNDETNHIKPLVEGKPTIHYNNEHKLILKINEQYYELDENTRTFKDITREYKRSGKTEKLEEISSIFSNAREEIEKQIKQKISPSTIVQAILVNEELVLVYPDGEISQVTKNNSIIAPEKIAEAKPKLYYDAADSLIMKIGNKQYQVADKNKSHCLNINTPILSRDFKAPTNEVLIPEVISLNPHEDYRQKLIANKNKISAYLVEEDLIIVYPSKYFIPKAIKVTKGRSTICNEEILIPGFRSKVRHFTKKYLLSASIVSMIASTFNPITLLFDALKKQNSTAVLRLLTEGANKIITAVTTLPSLLTKFFNYNMDLTKQAAEFTGKSLINPAINNVSRYPYAALALTAAIGVAIVAKKTGFVSKLFVRSQAAGIAR